ncbi:tetratricopeptide repeat protein [Luteolibacter algae]|uniref:Tetratricopeptide repeat protein n=1 Tax=Luteolibacter algae TaxID=454151 RepID=A0ABW5D8H4_9BACT
MKSIAVALIFFFQILAVFSTELPIATPERGSNPDLNQAVTLYRSGWNASATELARPLAEKGEKDAWFLLGLLLEDAAPARLSRAQAMGYAYGRAAAAGHSEAEFRQIITGIASTGEEKARTEGVRQLEEAATAGNPVAHRILGELHLRGFANGKRDAGKAQESWKRAAELGDKPSLLLLAKLAEGLYTAPEEKVADSATVVELYRQAAKGGDATASLRLGELLYSNNPEESRRWIEKAISAGAPEGHATLADLIAATDKLAARLHYEEGANAGDSRCMVKLAALLSEGEVLPPDSIHWLEQAVALGNADAAAFLGATYLKEQPTESYPYLLQAAKDGIPQAQADLASLYVSGRLGYADSHAAVIWLTEAMKSGDADFQYRLGYLHEQGTGTPVNYANAGVLYTMACNKGHAAAAARIARMSAEGLGTRKNPVQAWAYASLAIERGDHSVNDLLAGLDQKIGDAGREQAREALAKLRSASSPFQSTKD